MKRALTGVLCWSLATAAAPSRAASPDAAARLRPANRDYAEGRFQAALHRLEKLLQAPDLTDEAAAQALLVRAKCLAALRDYGHVEGALTEALGHDPGAKLDADADPPEVVALLESLRHRLKGTLRVKVEPASADWTLDGARQPGASFRGEVSIGRHELTVRKSPGAPPLLREVIVRPNRDADVNIVLPSEPVAGTVPMSTEPEAKPAPSNLPEAAATASSPAPSAVAPLSAGPSRMLEGPFASLRLNRDLAGGLSYEAGLGWDTHHLFATLSFLAAAVPSVELQAGVQQRRALGPVGAFVGLEGTYFFGSAGLFGGGVTCGVLVDATPWLEPYAALTAARVQASGPYRATYALASVGVRLRWPGR